MILACQNISKSFGDVPVLRNVNFHIEKNDKCGLIGINGAGKTTLLRVILGEEEADSGNVVISRRLRILSWITLYTVRCRKQKSISWIWKRV